MGLFRLILAISVIIAHAGPILNTRLYDGNMAVMIFFVISGFYMQLIAKKYSSNSNYSWLDFYRSRILKLYPAYIIIMLLTIISPLVFHIPLSQYGLTSEWVNSFAKLQKPVAAFIIFINSFIIGQEWTFIFSVGSDGTQFVYNPMRGLPLWKLLPVGQAWSISLELMFYALVPVLSRLKLRQLLILLTCILIVHGVIQGYFSEIYRSGTHRFFPTALRFFIIGMLACRFYSAVLLKRPLLRQLLLPLSCAIFYLHYILVPYSVEAAVYLIAAIIPMLFWLTKNSKIDQYLGEYSYLLYISHIVVFYTVKELTHYRVAETVLLLSILVALFLRHSILIKLEKLRQRFGARSTEVSLGFRSGKFYYAKPQYNKE